jgi:phospholipid/cholesterol/gamma-HCH transport system substrate-binding protein
LLLILSLAAGGGYEVHAQFQNAGQLVRGNVVEIGGVPAGRVEGFEITPGGVVDARLSIDDEHAPLRPGTRAVIRQGSQASVAGKYVDLHMPPEDGTDRTIPDGGTIALDDTTTVVEFDQFLSIFDEKTRDSLKGFIRGQNRQYAGRGTDAADAFPYLSPSLGQTASLFRELGHDQTVLERFLVDTSRFVTALAGRDEDLAALVGNLNRTTGALAAERVALADAVSEFPGFMRSANTTLANVRSTLDEVDPFVEASKPVARRLRPYLGQLKPFARNARPTVRNLATALRSGGSADDLVELARTYPDLARIAVDRAGRNGESRRGAFPELSEALDQSAPIVAHGRPYTTDLLGWFDDFSHTGGTDALGGFSRSQIYLNAFTLQLPPGVDCPSAAKLGEGCLLADLSDTLGFDTSNLRGEVFKALARTEQYKRCPGAAEEPAEDGSNVWSEAEQRELDCREEDRATGAIE